MVEAVKRENEKETEFGLLKNTSSISLIFWTYKIVTITGLMSLSANSNIYASSDLAFIGYLLNMFA